MTEIRIDVRVAHADGINVAALVDHYRRTRGVRIVAVDGRPSVPPKRTAGPAPVCAKRTVCETCGTERSMGDFVDRHGRTRASCSRCRGTCAHPPYGWTACPGCGRTVHRQEFRTRPDGSAKPGRPFTTCATCRKPA